MISGIYAYWDNINSYYVYIGKDSNISKNRRHYEHMAPCHYDMQPINKVLQRNPERYEYHIITQGNYDDIQLNKLEKLFIKIFKTFRYDYPNRSVFNFTIGGDGNTGYRKPDSDFKYTVSKMGFLSNGKQRYTIYNKSRISLITTIDKNYINILCDKLNNNILTEDEIRDINSFHYTVSKAGFYNKKQVYSILNKNNRSIIRSVNKERIYDICNQLKNGELTEEEVKEISFFRYTIAKMGYDNGKQQYGIYGKNQKRIKKSANKEALEKIVEALNIGIITEKEIKSIRSVKKILDLIN